MYIFNYDINSKEPIKIQYSSGTSVLVAEKRSPTINKSLIKYKKSGLRIQSYNDAE